MYPRPLERKTIEYAIYLIYKLEINTLANEQTFQYVPALKDIHTPDKFPTKNKLTDALIILIELDKETETQVKAGIINEKIDFLQLQIPRSPPITSEFVKKLRLIKEFLVSTKSSEAIKALNAWIEAFKIVEEETLTWAKAFNRYSEEINRNVLYKETEDEIKQKKDDEIAKKKAQASSVISTKSNPPNAEISEKISKKSLSQETKGEPEQKKDDEVANKQAEASYTIDPTKVTPPNAEIPEIPEKFTRGLLSQEIEEQKRIAKEKTDAVVLTASQAINKLNVDNNYINSIKKIIVEALHSIKSDPKDIITFVNSLGIKAFQDLTTEEAILAKLNALDHFQERVTTLLVLSEKCEFYQGIFKQIKVSDKDIKNKNSWLQNSIGNYLSKLLVADSLTDNIFEFMQIDMKILVGAMENIELQLNSQIQREMNTKEDVKIIKLIDRIISSQDKNKLGHLIREELKEYIFKTFNSYNIRKKDRALSDKRAKDMNEILDILENPPHQTDMEIINRLTPKLTSMKGRNVFTRLFDHSELVKNLEAVLKKYPQDAQARKKPKSNAPA